MRKLLGILVAAAALAAPVAALAFSPNDPLVTRQWYVAQDRVFNAFTAMPQLPTVRVAVIDSGIDAMHPELRGRILEAKSFVGGTTADVQGHGTFVAGEIAAATDNSVGIAGLAPSARLLIAKTVKDDGTIPPQAEANAIRWAVHEGARVINLSLGDTRDPVDPTHDGFSYAERRAIEYAVRSGVLVVAAAGNGTDAPSTPWPFASYPAALPHVLGVGAYGRTGDVPGFSNRDNVFVDVAAPGQDMLSLFPTALTKAYPSCREQGYSSCGSKEYRHADGTSFSAAQVSAAAATLFALRPTLRPDQVSALIEHSADDATPANGCNLCTIGRDSLTGFGRLDISSAVHALTTGPLPVADRFEPNDDARGEAAVVYGSKLRARATLDQWDDQTDVYAISVRRGQRITVRVKAKAILDASVVLWKPALQSLALARDSMRAKRSIHPAGALERVRYRAHSSGWYYVQVKDVRGSGPYSIRISIS